MRLFYGIAVLKEDVTTAFKDTIIAILAGTSVTLLRKRHPNGYDAEAIVTKDEQLLRIIFTVYKKELTELQVHDDKSSGTMSKPVNGEASLQE